MSVAAVPAPVALLLTDLVDSAALAARLGDAAMAEVWARHDRAARDLLVAWRGREIDKTDGFLLLFAQARDAVGYASAYHRALNGLEAELRQRHGPELRLRARAGLHVGVMTMRETPAEDVARGAKPVEVDGIGKPLAARVMSTALGGQTLITTAALEALGDLATPLAPGAGLVRAVSHGFWSVKGLPTPLELHEVGDDRAPFEPPPDAEKVFRVVRQGELWVPVRQVRHTLPAEPDAFVGRRAPLQEIGRRFDAAARLVSVLGIGGGGKTRLALRYGWSRLGEFAGGVWFCDLAAATSLEGLFGAVAQGLEVPLGPEDPATQLGHAIAGRGECLVVLDNFEQLARHAGITLGRWLERAPAARFLVTSREVLGIPGEEVLVLAPLAGDEAVKLFLRRARAARVDFDPQGEELAAVEPLVRLLDGLPLAIELAAARVRTLPPRALLARMSERFRILAGGGQRVDRQATLRATFDWSWDLLEDAERQALAQLSVFEGGFTLEAAEAVLAFDGLADEPWAMDVLQSLVDKSFVRSGAARFEMLGTVQEYAHGHLSGAGRLAGGGAAALESTQVRHGAWFAALPLAEVATHAAEELDNLVAACRRALARGDGAMAASTLERAWAALVLRGPFSLGATLAEALLALPGLAAGNRVQALEVLGQALMNIGRREPAQQALETALQLISSIPAGEAASARPARSDAAATELGAHEARLRTTLAALLARQGRVEEALSALAAAIALARAIGDTTLEVAALNGRGAIRFEQGHLAEAEADWLQALALAESSALARWQGSLLGNLANLHANRGEMARALPRFEQALEIARRLGDRKSEGNTLGNLCMLHHVLGQPDAAARCGEAALQVARDLGHPRLETVVLCNLGLVHAAALDDAAACARFESALVVARRSGDTRTQGQVLGYLGAARARRGDHADALADLEEGERLLAAAGDALSLALLLACRGEASMLAGRPEAAAASLARAEAIAAERAAGPESELGQALARLRRALAAAGSLSR